MEFKEKVAIVTGSSSGIGKAVAKQLINEGAMVIGIDIQNKVVENSHHLICDVGNEYDVISAIEKVTKITNKVDYLVNAAGVLTVGSRTQIKEQKLEQWEKILLVNMTGVLLMMKHTYELLKVSSAGAIVNISSDQANNSLEKSAPYAVSKAGINVLTRIAANEMYDDNIRVNAVAAGEVHTNFLSTLVDNEMVIKRMYKQIERKLPFGLAEPEDIASLVCYLLSEQAKCITGQVILLDSGKSIR